MPRPATSTAKGTKLDKERMKALEAQRLSSRQTKIYTIGKVTVCTDNPTHAEEFEKLKGEQWAKIKNIRI